MKTKYRMYHLCSEGVHSWSLHYVWTWVNTGETELVEDQVIKEKSRSYNLIEPYTKMNYGKLFFVFKRGVVERASNSLVSKEKRLLKRIDKILNAYPNLCDKEIIVLGKTFVKYYKSTLDMEDEDAAMLPISEVVSKRISNQEFDDLLLRYKELTKLED